MKQDNEIQLIERAIELALAEDAAGDDITTRSLIPESLTGKAAVLVKAGGTLAGIEIASRIFGKVDSALLIEVFIKDGTRIKPGDIAARVSGRVASILTAERTALNFLQRMSGVATRTAEYIALVKGLPARITDTRKTTPGLRVLDKYAVRMGGGRNHRMHLGDGVLVKDNHLVAARRLGLSFADIVTRARREAPPDTFIELEVTTPYEAREAAAAGADIILLDNMAPAAMREAVKLVGGRVKTEASGGITLANVREVAETGVDYISVGALTHSVKALDLSLELEPDSLRM